MIVKDGERNGPLSTTRSDDDDDAISLSHYLGPRPPMRPDSVPDLGAIQIIYLLTTYYAIAMGRYS